MAVRPVFSVSSPSEIEIVREMQVEFEWYPGFSLQQKQRSIASLHDSIIATTDLRHPLEISSKSRVHLGVELSAFNLLLEFRSEHVFTASVETAYQGSKVFDGCPRADLDRFALDSRGSRHRVKELEKGRSFTGWQLGRYRFPLSSGVDFYNWLYLGALHQQPGLLERLLEYDCFTDIEFNPRKSLACQARSAALAKALIRKEGSLLRFLREVGRLHDSGDCALERDPRPSEQMLPSIQLLLEC